jgi:hypothetical protein
MANSMQQSQGLSTSFAKEDCVYLFQQLNLPSFRGNRILADFARSNARMDDYSVFPSSRFWEDAVSGKIYVTAIHTNDMNIPN